MPNAQRASCAWQPASGALVNLHRINEPNIAVSKHGEVEEEFGLGTKAFGWSDDAQPSFKITFNTIWTKGTTQEYDWISAARDKEEGTFFYAKGATVDSYPCKVSKADQSTDAKGITRVNVEISALYVVPG